MHYYQFNIADYRKDTQHLSPIEHYIYRELMDWYYLDETAIPKKTQLVLRRLRLVSENEPNLVNILDEFFTMGDSGWHHKRIDAEISKYHNKQDTAKVNGSKGGRPKKPRKTQSVNLANPTLTQTKPKPNLTINHKPVTNNHKPNTPARGFEDFWTVYPKKVDKQAAERAWIKLAPSDDLIVILITDCQERVTAGEWCTGPEKQFIPGPAPYLNGRKWENEIIPRGPPAKPELKTHAEAAEAELRELGMLR